jgi:hypothetical protein
VVDPAHPTPPLVYRSAFEVSPLQTDATPGDWIALNARVGQFKRGHIDIVRQEDQAPAGPPRGAAPTPPPGGGR